MEIEAKEIETGSLAIEDIAFGEALRSLFSKRDSFVGILRSQGLDVGVAEDIVQQAYIKIIRYLEGGKKYDPEKSLNALFHTTLKNLKIDHFRGQKRRDVEISEQISCTDNPESNVQSKKISEKLNATINQISDTLQRNVLVHRLVEELSIEETATLLGIDENKVNALLFAARKRLKKILGQEFENLI